MLETVQDDGQDQQKPLKRLPIELFLNLKDSKSQEGVNLKWKIM